MPVVEIGGTHVLGALVDPVAGTVVPGSERRAALPAGGSASEILDVIVERATGLAAAPGAHWVVAVPGPFDYQRGIALFEGVGKFESLYGVDLGRVLLDAVPARPSHISFLNDADAFLLGEWRYGAARGLRRCAAITLGTGVGSAFVADGRIVADGPDVPPEGRVDLLRIDGGPLEDTVSRRAIRAAYAGRTGTGHAHLPDVAELADLARAGDTAAADTLRHAFTALGRALAPWLAAFDADGVVVGGSMAGSWDLVEPALAAGLTAWRDASVDAAAPAGPPPRWTTPLPASRRGEAALLGAAYTARRTRIVPDP